MVDEEIGFSHSSTTCVAAGTVEGGPDDNLASVTTDEQNAKGDGGSATY